MTVTDTQLFCSFATPAYGSGHELLEAAKSIELTVHTE